MIRNLINHPVKHNVIFNINNGEEVGLYGAAAFMKHPWSKDVKAFVNLGRSRRQPWYLFLSMPLRCY